ncbi:MAG: hypothetical protein AAF570_23465 [Bacteroidota bacterium]
MKRNTSARPLGFIALLLTALCFSLTSCNVKEGEGGLGTITGKIWALDYNAELTNLLGQYYAPGENVYIVYGDDEVYGDQMDTHHDGTFRFDFLRKGTYHIYAYSKDTTGVSIAELPIIKTVEITDRKQVVDIGELVIVK